MKLIDKIMRDIRISTQWCLYRFDYEDWWDWKIFRKDLKSILEKHLPKEEAFECLCDSPWRFCVRHQKYVQFPTKDDSPKEEVAEECEHTYTMPKDFAETRFINRVCTKCGRAEEVFRKSEPKKIELEDMFVRWAYTSGETILVEDKSAIANNIRKMAEVLNSLIK